jgi:hypothetical protein
VAVALPTLALPLRAQETGPGGERRVFTYFYYWYQPPDGDPKNPQASHDLTLHFPPDRPGDWRYKDWYLAQFQDMAAAGIDVALPVYWGHQLYPETTWSTGGLEPMVAALDELARAGKPYPKLGLFFDTYVIDGADLTNPDKLGWFLTQLREYFKRVPARHRAMQDGRPIIWLYLSNFANSFDVDTFRNVGDVLQVELGARPYWVAETSWRNPTWTDGDGLRHFDPRRLMPFEAFYRWGAAAGGPMVLDWAPGIASVGPGYDDTGITWRGEERSVRLREEGCYYARSWAVAQSVSAKWVVVETWNELYEGSAVAETQEYGRQYLDLTRQHATAFKRGRPIEVPASCPPEPIEPDEVVINPVDLSGPAAVLTQTALMAATPAPTATLGPSTSPSPGRDEPTATSQPTRPAAEATATPTPSVEPTPEPTATVQAEEGND